MANTITPERLAAMLPTLADTVIKDNNSLQLVACKTVEGMMKKRIFNRGAATDGSKIGQYKSKSHIKKRKEYGAQTSYVDLQMSGDTLMKSLQVGKSGSDTVLGFTRGKSDKATPYEIAGFQEKQRNKKIFTPSVEETAAANKAVLIAIKNKVSEVLKSW
jgi:hypothetical protein